MLLEVNIYCLKSEAKQDEYTNKRRDRIRRIANDLIHRIKVNRVHYMVMDVCVITPDVYGGNCCYRGRGNRNHYNSFIGVRIDRKLFKVSSPTQYCFSDVAMPLSNSFVSRRLIYNIFK